MSTTASSTLGTPYFHFSPAPNSETTVPAVICGTLPNLTALSYPSLQALIGNITKEETWVEALDTIKFCGNSHLFFEMNKLLIIVLPTDASRHNCPSRPHVLTKILLSTHQNIAHSGSFKVILATQKIFTFSLSAAVARVFSLFSLKTCSKSRKLTDIYVDFCLVDKEVEMKEMSPSDRQCLASLSDGIRRAQNIVDSPANFMDTDMFLEQIKQVHADLDSFNVKLTVIDGEQLLERKLAGIYGVGKQALSTPKMVILTHTPPNATETFSWVGKGIVYDTGGLSLKPKGGMAGMKRDCGGAASVLGAFYVAVKEGFTQNLHAIFCLAENAIGPNATRPDDIHTLYSGKTVEINNPDAEGRLVLGDGVHFADKDLKSQIIVDLATLTGAQGPTTGSCHGALLTNSGPWERITMQSGRITGDVVFPIVFCPEMHFSEFSSAIADMKNSVANRSNATSSCAGLFIHSHLSNQFKGSWVHVDMAGPVYSGERATGFGVGLLVGMFGKYSKSEYFQLLSRHAASLVD